MRNVAGWGDVKIFSIEARLRRVNPSRFEIWMPNFPLGLSRDLRPCVVLAQTATDAFLVMPVSFVLALALGTCLSGRAHAVDAATLFNNAPHAFKGGFLTKDATATSTSGTLVSFEPNNLKGGAQPLFKFGLPASLANASNHSTSQLPILLAGGGFKHGQHQVVAPGGDLKQTAPLSKLFVSMLQRMGIETDKFGDFSGTVPGLV